MTKSFKNWLSLSEIALGVGLGDMKDNQPTKTANATTKIAQQWLSNPSNTQQQTDLATNNTSSANLTKKFLDAGAKAVQNAPSTLAGQTTAPEVAAFLQKQFGNSQQKTPNLKPNFMKKS